MGCAHSSVPQSYDEIAVVQENVVHIPEEPIQQLEEPINMSEVRVLLDRLGELHKELTTLTCEKYGIQYSLDTYQRKLVELTSDQSNAKAKYLNLLNQALDRDVDDVHKALNSQQIEKRILIDILTARSKWQIDLIAQIYDRKYHIPLFHQVRESLTTSMGRFTGSQTELGRLLKYMTTEQPERDGRLLKSFIADADGIVEVCSSYI
jgi:hypothetical protein